MGGWGWRRLLGFGIALGIELDWGGLEHGGGYGGRDGHNPTFKSMTNLIT